MIKDKTHSELVKKMNEYRKQSTETQKLLKKLKDPAVHIRSGSFRLSPA